MKPVLCSVCTQTVSPKKRLKCKNNQCKIVCHYKCDQVILSPIVAKTIESYYCKTCREGGDSIVFRKQHRTRSKSPSVTGKSDSDKSVVAEGNSQDSKDVSLNESTPVMNNDIHSKSEVDTNHVQSCPKGSLSQEENELKSGEILISPTGSRDTTGGIVEDTPETPHEETIDIEQASQDELSPVTKLNDPAHQLNTKIQHLTLQQESQAEHIIMLECESKEKDKKIKEKDKLIMNKNCKIAEMEDAHNQLLKTLNLRNEQIRLLKDHNALEVEERLRLKAQINLKDSYCKNIEKQYFQLKGLTPDDDKAEMQQQIADKSKQIQELNEDLNDLRLKTEGLLKENTAYKKEISNMRNSQTGHNDIGKEQLGKLVQNMKDKIDKIDYLIHNTEPYQPAFHDPDYSPISETPLQQLLNSVNESSSIDGNDDYRVVSNSPVTPSNLPQRSEQRTPRHDSQRRGSSRDADEHRTAPRNSSPTQDNSNHRFNHHNSRRRNSSNNVIENRTAPPRLPATPDNSNRRTNHRPSGHNPERIPSSNGSSRYHHSPIRSNNRGSRSDSRNRHHRNRETSQRYYNDDREAEEIKRKKKNIIIHGLPETSSNKDTLDEFVYINRRILGNRYFEKYDVHHIGRIGEPQIDKPRPVKIELNDTICKIDIMRNAHHLKDHHTYNRLSIMHDLTPYQLKELNRLRELAKTQEQDDRNHTYKVRGPPGQWKIEKLPKN